MTNESSFCQMLQPIRVALTFAVTPFVARSLHESGIYLDPHIKQGPFKSSKGAKDGADECKEYLGEIPFETLKAKLSEENKGG